jgi:hypothetical protein
MTPEFSLVIAGLDPAIHGWVRVCGAMDARIILRQAQDEVRA